MELNEAKGKVKEMVGQVVNSPDVEAEGKAEHGAGKVGKMVGQIEKVIEECARRALPKHGPGEAMRLWSPAQCWRDRAKSF